MQTPTINRTTLDIVRNMKALTVAAKIYGEARIDIQISTEAVLMYSFVHELRLF